jgi:hypothetical protein
VKTVAATGRKGRREDGVGKSDDLPSALAKGSLFWALSP